MNLDMIIYDRMPRKANYGSNLKSTTTVFIHQKMLENSAWNTYNRGYLLRYSGVRDFLLEMAFITNLAYTYKHTKKTEYQLSPYYILSLYNAMDWDAFTKYTNPFQKTINIVKTSRMIRDYLTIVKSGGMKYGRNTWKNDYTYSVYEVTDKLKEFADSISDDDVLLKVDLGDILERAGRREELSCLSDKLYVIYDENGIEHEVFGLSNARKWVRENENCSSPIFIGTPNRILRQNTISKHTFSEIDNRETCSEKQSVSESKPVSIKNKALINRSEIEKVLMNPSSPIVYSQKVMQELFRMYDSTSKSTNEIEIKYYQTKQGRHYCLQSSVQMFPRELRERVFSDYVAVDMECSIFSLYKNLAKQYGYKKPTPELDELIADRKKYRYRFVTDTLTYEGVKSILTAIAYGAVVDIYNMYMCYYNRHHYRNSSLLKYGYYGIDVINMCGNNKILNLTKELRSVGKHIIRRCTDKKNKCIVNSVGNKLSLNVRKSFGVKMAHIYQACESTILTELTNVEIGDKKLSEIENGIGLFLHDGIYIRRELVEKYDVCTLFKEHIKNTLGYEVSYEVEE